jgi:Cupredoxin-like domain
MMIIVISGMLENLLTYSRSATRRFRPRLSEGKLVAVGIIAMIAMFALLIVFVNGGGVRHVSIFWKEKVETTIAFRNVNGELKVVGLRGTTQIDPTLVSRTGDTAYALTVINQDTTPHIFYIGDGLNLDTKVIRPGQNDTITIYPKNEGTYNYYDWVTKGKPLGQFKALKVGIEGGD